MKAKKWGLYYSSWHSAHVASGIPLMWQVACGKWHSAHVVHRIAFIHALLCSLIDLLITRKHNTDLRNVLPSVIFVEKRGIDVNNKLSKTEVNSICLISGAAVFLFTWRM
jgi:hypothetical protein